MEETVDNDYLKDHKNSLNVNISTALIETSLEALKIFNK